MENYTFLYCIGNEAFEIYAYEKKKIVIPDAGKV